MTQVSGQSGEPRPTDDLSGISGYDSAESAQAVQAQQPAVLVSLEGLAESFPVWHGAPHIADPALLARVEEELQRAGLIAPDQAIPLFPDNDGPQEHRRWHLDNPGVQHPLTPEE